MAKVPPKKKGGGRKAPPSKKSPPAKKTPPKKAAPKKVAPKKGPPSGKELTPEQEMLARGFRPTDRSKRARQGLAEEMHTGRGEADIDEG